MQLPLIQSTDSTLNLFLARWKSLLDPVLSKSGSGVGAIGEVRSAFLTQAQWQSQMTLGWVLCDGRNVSGSNYSKLTGNSTVPDMRGTVPRMKDNGRGLNPDGDLALGAYQADQFASHTHTISGTTYATVGGAANGSVVGGGTGGSGSFASSLSANATGGNETRAKSMTLNFFIRIN